jgi:hypothetical protein
MSSRDFRTAQRASTSKWHIDPVRVTICFLLATTIFQPTKAIYAESRQADQLSAHNSRTDDASNNTYRALERNLKHFGSDFISTSRSSKSLRLKQETSAETYLEKQISATGGTISFWIYPLWEKHDPASHTFISLPWNNPKKSYLAVTLGWWEPQGKNRLYFIASNQEFVHCSSPYQLERNAWTMVTAVWESGSKGYCKLFINDGKIATQEQSFTGNYSTSGPLYLGTDRGTTQAQGRSANALIDTLLIYDHPFSEEEVKVSYQAQEKDPEGAIARKWRWLESGSTTSKQATRAKTGELLESRVMFDEDMHWAVSKDNADRILTRLKAAGFNVYVPCVWHGNGTYYPTSLAETEPKLESVITAYDPLAYLIQKAHSLGIEVHPWFTVMRRENMRHPQFFGEGVPDGSYDVHNQEFRNFITDLMVDLVRRYDVDGVNLDYIRAMGLCTAESCQADYKRITGSHFWPDYYLRGIMGPARSLLEQWQDKAVRDIVDNFSKRAKALKPNLVISVDGHPKPKTGHRPLEGRDEINWMNDGLIDVVFAMDYRETIDYETIDAVRKDLRRSDRLIVLFGNYDRLNNAAPAISRKGTLVAKYATYAQHRWPSSGIGFYIYGQMTDEQVSALRDGPFREEALPIWKHAGR